MFGKSMILNKIKCWFLVPQTNNVFLINTHKSSTPSPWFPPKKHDQHNEYWSLGPFISWANDLSNWSVRKWIFIHKLYPVIIED